MMECENTKHNYPKNVSDIVHCMVSVVYPCDRMADWELQLAAAAQRHRVW